MIVIRPFCGNTPSQPACGCYAVLSIPDNDYVVSVNDYVAQCALSLSQCALSLSQGHIWILSPSCATVNAIAEAAHRSDR